MASIVGAKRLPKVKFYWYLDFLLCYDILKIDVLFAYYTKRYVTPLTLYMYAWL